MTKEEKIKIIDKIKISIEETLIQINEYRELTKPIHPDNAIGRVSRIDAINNKSVIEAALRECEKKLSNLKFVKSLIDKDNFGICISCKNLLLSKEYYFALKARNV